MFHVIFKLIFKSLAVRGREFKRPTNLFLALYLEFLPSFMHYNTFDVRRALSQPELTIN